MNTRKIVLAAVTAIFMTGIASPAFAEGDIDGEEIIFETSTITQIEPVSSPQIIVETQPQTFAEKTFDLTDGR